MTADELKTAFLTLPPERKTRVVSSLAYNLTVGARAAYPGQVEESLAAKKLSSLNEIQHTVTAKLMNTVAGRPLAFPDEGFLNVLFEKAQRAGCERELIEAFCWSLAVKE